LKGKEKSLRATGLRSSNKSSACQTS